MLESVGDRSTIRLVRAALVSLWPALPTWIQRRYLPETNAREQEAAPNKRKRGNLCDLGSRTTIPGTKRVSNLQASNNYDSHMKRRRSSAVGDGSRLADHQMLAGARQISSDRGSSNYPVASPVENSTQQTLKLDAGSPLDIYASDPLLSMMQKKQHAEAWSRWSGKFGKRAATKQSPF